MTRAEILAKITEILSDVVDNDNLHLKENTTADTVEDWDSINHVKLLLGLENDLGIQFETEEVNSVSNVGELINVIQAKLAKGH